MSAQATWTGFDELVRALANAPEEIHSEAAAIIKEETEGAAIELATSYPKKTGTLARRVRTEYPKDLVGKVKSKAPHAHLWHWGTKVRRTAKGANRGQMPAANPEPLVPISRRRRARMMRRLKDLLIRRGFTITDV